MFSDRFIFEPPKPIKRSYYRCDVRFHIDDILDMYNDYNDDGIVYIDGKTCSLYKHNNGYYTKVFDSDIRLIGKFKNGGQSQNRLMRIREENRDYFISETIENVIKTFYDKKNSECKVVNLIVYGPGNLKSDIIKSKLLKQYFNNIHELTLNFMDYDKVSEFINNIDDPSEKIHIDDITQLIDTADDKLVFGDDIWKLIDECQLAKIYIHNTILKINDMKLKYSPDIIKLSSNKIMQYGGIIGIKWF